MFNIPKFATHPENIASVRSVSDRLALNPDDAMSTGELAAAAIVNGRIDLFSDDPDFRKAIIRAGPEWAHAAIDVIFANQEAEMALRPGQLGCPFGDQRIYTRD